MARTKRKALTDKVERTVRRQQRRDSALRRDARHLSVRGEWA